MKDAKSQFLYTQQIQSKKSKSIIMYSIVKLKDTKNNEF